MWRSMALAGVGGLLPTLSRLAASFTVQPDQPLPRIQIVFGLLLFFVIGLVLDVALNAEHDLRRAIVIGIAAPGLITSIVAGATTPPVANPAVASVATLVRPAPPPSLVETPTAALHGPLIAPAVAARRPLVVRVAVVGAGLRTPIVLAISAMVAGHEEALGSAMPGLDARFAVPPAATAVKAHIAGQAATRSLPAGDGPVAMLASVHTGATGSGDILWALGGPRDRIVTAIDLTPSTVPD